MKAELVMVEGESVGRKTIISPHGKITLGRHDTCDVILTDTSVSRLHALITFSPKGSIIVDLGSSSGTYLNDRRVQKSALTFGDEVRVGANVFKFRRQEDDGKQEKEQSLKGKVSSAEIDKIAGVCKNCGIPVPKKELPISISEKDMSQILCKKCSKLAGQRCRKCDRFVSQEDIALGKGVYIQNRYFCDDHLPLEENTPRRVAQYKLLMPLGGGAVSNVYKAKHLFIGTIIALKLMRPKLSAQKSIIERFFREAQFGVKFDHPNIVRIFDAGKADKYYYLIMDYFEGETLYELGGREPLPTSQVIQIARQLCNAVGYAHSWGVIHRDIKPSNILMNPTGEIKLTDLGAAKEWENSDCDLTRRGEFIGTLRYQPPEQIANASKVDQRADIYAIGSCLFFCLTGKPPFEGKTFAELVDKVLGGQYTPIEELVPNVPVPLRDMITQCLQRDAAKRPQNIAEAQAYLDAL